MSVHSMQANRINGELFLTEGEVCYIGAFAGERGGDMGVMDGRYPAPLLENWRGE
jgi:hypothetical protein